VRAQQQKRELHWIGGRNRGRKKVLSALIVKESKPQGSVRELGKKKKKRRSHPSPYRKRVAGTFGRPQGRLALELRQRKGEGGGQNACAGAREAKTVRGGIDYIP